MVFRMTMNIYEFLFTGFLYTWFLLVQSVEVERGLKPWLPLCAVQEMGFMKFQYDIKGVYERKEAMLGVPQTEERKEDVGQSISA